MKHLLPVYTLLALLCLPSAFCMDGTKVDEAVTNEL